MEISESLKLLKAKNKFLEISLLIFYNNVFTSPENNRACDNTTIFKDSLKSVSYSSFIEVPAIATSIKSINFLLLL